MNSLHKRTVLALRTTGKEDHQTGLDHCKKALEYSNKASQLSQEAHRKSEQSTGEIINSSSVGLLLSTNNPIRGKPCRV
jgi:hypothetical protein